MGLAMRGSLGGALLALACTGSGCIGLFDFGAGAMESPRFPELQGPRPTEGRSRLWQELKEVVNKHYRLKVIDEHDYHLQTEWEEHLAPMYKSGFRRQVNAWVYADADRGPWFEIQVLTEINANIKQPLSSSTADWEDNGRDNRREKAIIWEVETRVRPPGKGGRGGERPDGPAPDTAPYRDPDPLAEDDDAARRRKKLWGD